MPDGLVYLAQAIVHFASPWSLFEIFWATLLGIAIGALPGLTATLGVALLTTLTFRMGADDAILILICSYVGAIYGGSRSAILLNIPGTPANAATTLDGFPLARAGHAGRAMGLATTGSFFGSLIGMLMLALVAPLLAAVRARLRQLRVFLAGRVRHRDLGPSHGARRSAQGLDRGLPGPDGRHGRARRASSPTSASPSAAPSSPAVLGFCRRWWGPSALPRSSW